MRSTTAFTWRIIRVVFDRIFFLCVWSFKLALAYTERQRDASRIDESLPVFGCVIAPSHSPPNTPLFWQRTLLPDGTERWRSLSVHGAGTERHSGGHPLYRIPQPSDISTDLHVPFYRISHNGIFFSSPVSRAAGWTLVVSVGGGGHAVPEHRMRTTVPRQHERRPRVI